MTGGTRRGHAIGEIRSDFARGHAIGEIRSDFTRWKCFRLILSATTLGVHLTVQPEEIIVRKHSVLCVGLGAFLSFGLLGVGCSSNNNSTPDAGKKDGSAGSGGKGGSGGSVGVGGSASGGSAAGGSIGSGGAIGAGGSASGGSSAGGSSGPLAGGSSGTGGAVTGGSSGTGGSATGGSSGTGGSGGLDGGSSDALDAPMGIDVAIDSASVDTGTVSLDVGALDMGEDAPEVDMAVSLDTGIDMTALDVGGMDASANCIQRIVDNGYAAGTAAPCSACHDNSVNLTTICQNAVNCLITTPCASNDNNCRTTCLNNVGASSVAATCVNDLVTAACQ